MATVNGQEISNKYGGGIVFANNFTVNTNTPLDVRLTKTTKSELLDPTSWVKNSNGQYLVYTGMLVVVTSDTTASNNGIWEYVGPDDVATADPTLETNWVHLISGETTNTTINAAIDAKIQGLDVPGYAQAEMSGDGTTLTIKGIQEVDGKIGIPNSDNLNLNITIDGGYNKETNKIATQDTVTNAITGLNAETVQAVTKETSGNITTLTFKGVKEANGVIAQGDGTDSFIVGNANLKIQIGSSAATNVFSANATEDSTIKLDGYVFRKNENNEISVITPTAVSERNRLVTEQDIANLSGAMHYQGAIADESGWPTTTPKKGDVYIAIGDFKKDTTIIESGDMIVFGDDGSFTVVQSNITLGTKSGQIAKNDGDLVNNKLVIATLTGIKTIDFDGTNLTSTENDNNTRTLSYTNGDLDSNGLLYHDVTITDTFKVIGKDFNQSINISSNNRSIEIAKKTVEGVDTGVVVDLVWNTSIE